MLTLVVTLYALSLLLPVTGLVLLYLGALASKKELDKAPKAKDGSDGVTVGQFDALITQARNATAFKPLHVARDFAFIGLGLGAGTVASLLALTL